MSLAADPRYRSVRVTWKNYDAQGGEYVQIFAKAAGGSWAVVQTVPVADLDQGADWATALPLTAYDLAMRFVNGTVPTEGYEGDPDSWTAATAAQSKSTITTTSANITSFAGTFVSAGQPVNLVWASAQQNVPYLLEKNAGAGWVTVISGLVANSYAYTIPAGELNTTVQFRVTAQRGAVSGPTLSCNVTMAITVGTPTWASASFAGATGTVSLAWNAAANATQYLVEKSVNGGASWTTLVVQAGLSYSYVISSGEANLTMKYRVTGQQGSYSSAASAVQDVATTIAITKPVISAASVHFNASFGTTELSATFSGGGDVYSYWGIIRSSVLLGSVLAPATVVGGSRDGQWAAPGDTVNVEVWAQSVGQLVTVKSDPFPVVVT